jgi:ParB-like chromosome segregation protein Spo0J
VTTTAKSRRRVQPIDSIRWVDRNLLVANDWNPNRVFRPELDLLATSLREDGWTQPIVARERDDGTLEIIDGFHRWMLAGEPDIASITDGMVPVCVLAADAAGARISTVRHNRARGQHYVDHMASIIDALADMGLTDEELCDRLGMEPEEVRRLKEHGDVLRRIGQREMGEAWRSAPLGKTTKQ